jgi:D-alanyl-D-alanine carboxypeptidase (penicillin-binding protein 5/6)
MSWSFASVVLTLILAGPVTALPKAVNDYKAEGWVVASSEKVLWSHNMDIPYPPASLTKIMTVMLSLRKIPAEEIITVSNRASAETGTTLGLKTGDRIRHGLLAAAALMESGNDACMAIAEHVGGSAEKFVEMMNAEAAAMGLLHTHFQNPCGHDAPGQYASASDILQIARAAVKDPLFAAIISNTAGSFSTVDGKRTFSFINKNALIGRYPGALGVKTGTTPKAGKCLVALVRRDGVEVWLVALNAKERWWATTKVLDEALRSLGVLPNY